MNWDSVDAALLAHWRKLGQFRARHAAIAKGTHRKLGDAPYTFARVHTSDRIVAAVGASGTVKLPVADVFADGTRLRDAYSGAEATVAAGTVELTADPRGVVLLEALK